MSVLIRATELLDRLRQQPATGWSVSALAEACDLPVATVSRLLQQLAALAWVVQDGQRGSYRLGPRAWAMAGSERFRERVVSQAQPAMAALAADWPGASVLLITLAHHGQVVVWGHGPDQHLDHLRQPIAQQPWHGVGCRALVAALAPDQRRRWLDRVGLPTPAQWPGVATRRELLAELRVIRHQGIACQPTAPDGMSAYASTYTTSDGDTAALGVYLPAQTPHASLPDRLRATTATLSSASAQAMT